MKKYCANNKLLITSIVIAILIVCNTCMTVIGSGKKGAASDNAIYFQHLESEYVRNARTLMNEQGFMNAGVTMNHCLNNDGSRIYMVKLHHERLSKMSETRISEVITLLESIPFEDGDIQFELI